MPRPPSPWSSTLRLPKSKFPIRPLAVDQPNLLQRCTDDYYNWQRTAAQPPFILHDGPPYANGSLHIGHALNKILKDIICRTNVSRGRSVQYIPGWDCHGLPIELKALESAAVKKDALSIRNAARQLAQSAIQEQKAEFKSWAVAGDWKNAWTTMDQRFEVNQLRIFQKMVQKGLIHRQNRPVYWSPSSRTALAEAELEYRDDHISLSAMVKLPLSHLTVNGDAIHNAHVVIWTTTPWTLPANMAVAFHRDMEYTLVSSRHGPLIIASNRKDYVEQFVGEKLEAITQFPGSTLEDQSLSYSAPFGETRSMIHADFVTSDTGTGFVHCAPGHGMEDYEALQPQIRSGSVTVAAPVDDNGYFYDVPTLTGRSVLGSGNTSVIEILRQKGLILATQKYQHKYPYDWRTKKPVIIRATSQWFADVRNIRQAALDALEHVNFHPPSGKARLQSFVRNRSEWCISRQRAWGLPIPALYNITTGEALLTESSVGHIIKTLNERGTDAWWSDPEDDSSWVAPEYQGVYKRGKDTMDVWFDSGSSWAQLDQKSDHVSDAYVEGTDQHRGWFQSSLLTYNAYSGSSHAPYRSLITHGFTLDQHGKKMSKSLGNVISPQEIIQGTLTKSNKQGNLGPDMLRLWVASCDFTKDVVVSPAVLENVQSFLHKYRITFKLLLGTLEDFDPKNGVEYNALHLVDQIAVWQLFQAAELVRQAYRTFEFHRAVAAINQYVVSDFSAFYIESIKDRLYCSKPESMDRLAAQSVLYNILFELQAMFVPIMPLLVEEVFQYSPKSLQDHLLASRTRLEPLTPPPNHSQLEVAWSYLQVLNSTVKVLQEKARNEKRIGSSLESYVRLEIPQGDTKASKILEQESIQLALKDMVVASGLMVTYPSEKAYWPWKYEVEVKVPDGTHVRIIVHAPPGDRGKCARCWKYTVDLLKASTDELGNLCARCSDLVKS